MSHALNTKASNAFFQRPSVAKFNAIQQLVFASSDYDPAAESVTEIEQQLRHANPGRLLRRLEQLSCEFDICPRMHYVEARLRESLGEVDLMQQSIKRLQICLEMIAETGEGSRDSPFVVTFVTDMDDTVRSFGEKVRYQQPVLSKLGQFDVLTSHSGIEFWFDVSELARVRNLREEVTKA